MRPTNRHYHQTRMPYGCWFNCPLPPMSPGKHKTLPQKKHVASSQENKTTKKSLFISFFSSSGGGHFRRDSVQGSPPPSTNRISIILPVLLSRSLPDQQQQLVLQPLFAWPQKASCWNGLKNELGLFCQQTERNIVKLMLFLMTVHRNLYDLPSFWLRDSL